MLNQHLFHVFMFFIFQKSICYNVTVTDLCTVGTVHILHTSWLHSNLNYAKHQLQSGSEIPTEQLHYYNTVQYVNKHVLLCSAYSDLWQYGSYCLSTYTAHHTNAKPMFDWLNRGNQSNMDMYLCSIQYHFVQHDILVAYGRYSSVAV